MVLNYSKQIYTHSAEKVVVGVESLQRSEVSNAGWYWAFEPVVSWQGNTGIMRGFHSLNVNHEERTNQQLAQVGQSTNL